MRLLLVNDDGAAAPGIQILARTAAACGHEVTIYAPDRERSGAGHSMSATDTMTAVPLCMDDIQAYQVNGTPADCLRLGAFLMKKRVDLVLSGINNGPNLGATVVCSGTVHAALEAAMIGLPAMAVSMGQAPCRYYETAAQIAMYLLPWLMENPLPQGCMYNLNVPDRPMREILGIRPAALAHNFFSHLDYAPAGEGWRPVITGQTGQWEKDSDISLVRQGYASITALTWNMELPCPQILSFADNGPETLLHM